MMGTQTEQYLAEFQLDKSMRRANERLLSERRDVDRNAYSDLTRSDWWPFPGCQIDRFYEDYRKSFEALEANQ